MGESKIEWTDETWNPTRGCTRVSEGCRNCYAERQAIRQAGPGGRYEGLVRMTSTGPKWTGRVRVADEKLAEPLHWKRPRLVFVDSMSDLFHEDLPAGEIARVFAVMGLAERHTYQVLTKRPERMLELISSSDWWHDVGRLMEWHAENVERLSTGAMMGFDAWWQGIYERRAFPNVWLGTSAETQDTLEQRAAKLKRVPAAVRFISLEPLLEHVNPTHALRPLQLGPDVGFEDDPRRGPFHSIDWLIVGGESGPRARRCDVEWIRDVVKACRVMQVPCFVKQLGAKISVRNDDLMYARLPDRKGANPAEWPEDLRVRQFPEVRR